MSQPPLHGRNHRYGGSDPLEITWESVGEGGGGGGGIQFDTDPQAGGTLDIQTSGAITFEAPEFYLFSDAPGAFYSLQLDDEDSTIDLKANQVTVHLGFVDSGGDFKIYRGSIVTLQVDTEGRTLVTTAADPGKFLVMDHTGAATFRVDDDGSVHIKTGTSIVADL